jgi:hypothetical protein
MDYLILFTQYILLCSHTRFESLYPFLKNRLHDINRKLGHKFCKSHRQLVETIKVLPWEIVFHHSKEKKYHNAQFGLYNGCSILLNPKSINSVKFPECFELSHCPNALWFFFQKFSFPLDHIIASNAEIYKLWNIWYSFSALTEESQFCKY